MATDTTELAEIDDTGMIVAEPFSPTDARAHAVADTLTAAYSKASTLSLTPEESTALAAIFPDDAFRRGAGGDEELIYIEHAYLRERMNRVLGVGASVPIRRREWSEKFTYTDKYTKQQKEGVRVYVDLVLIVRGCVVGEAIGDSTYYPHNPKTNFSDALESAKSNAFRRCCKEFGIGLQAWMKGWGEGWKEREAAVAKLRAEREQIARDEAARKRSADKTTTERAPVNQTPGKTSPAEMQSQADEVFGPQSVYNKVKTAWLQAIAANECEARRGSYSTAVTARFNESKLTQGEYDALMGLIVDGTALPADPNAPLPPIEPARGAAEDRAIRAYVATGQFDEAVRALDSAIASGAIRGEQSSALHAAIEQGRKNAEKGRFVTA